MTEYQAVLRFNKWLDAVQESQGDNEWVYLREKEALSTYQNLLSNGVRKESADSMSCNVVEKINDLYIELNAEKRFSMDLTEKLKAAGSSLGQLELQFESLRSQITILKDKNAVLTGEIQTEKDRFQRIREDIYTDGERMHVLSRVAADPRSSEVKKLQDKIALLQQRISFLEKT